LSEQRAGLEPARLLVSERHRRRHGGSRRYLREPSSYALAYSRDDDFGQIAGAEVAAESVAAFPSGSTTLVSMMHWLAWRIEKDSISGSWQLLSVDARSANAAGKSDSTRGSSDGLPAGVKVGITSRVVATLEGSGTVPPWDEEARWIFEGVSSNGDSPGHGSSDTAVPRVTGVAVRVSSRARDRHHHQNRTSSKSSATAETSRVRLALCFFGLNRSLKWTGPRWQEKHTSSGHCDVQGGGAREATAPRLVRHMPSSFILHLQPYRFALYLCVFWCQAWCGICWALWSSGQAGTEARARG